MRFIKGFGRLSFHNSIAFLNATPAASNSFTGASSRFFSSSINVSVVVHSSVSAADGTLPSSNCATASKNLWIKSPASLAVKSSSFTGLNPRHFSLVISTLFCATICRAHSLSSRTISTNISSFFIISPHLSNHRLVFMRGTLGR